MLVLSYILFNTKKISNLFEQLLEFAIYIEQKSFKVKGKNYLEITKYQKNWN